MPLHTAFQPGRHRVRVSLKKKKKKDCTEEKQEARDNLMDNMSDKLHFPCPHCVTAALPSLDIGTINFCQGGDSSSCLLMSEKEAKKSVWQPYLSVYRDSVFVMVKMFS